MQKYVAENTQTEIAGEGLLDELDRFVAVLGYHLRSTSFSVEDVRISAFTGELLLKTQGPQQLVNLVHLLLRAGIYSAQIMKLLRRLAGKAGLRAKPQDWDSYRDMNGKIAESLVLNAEPAPPYRGRRGNNHSLNSR